ncbi:reverse transcriptase domain-containing protein [Tanacetum coccineum]
MLLNSNRCDFEVDVAQIVPEDILLLPLGVRFSLQGPQRHSLGARISRRISEKKFIQTDFAEALGHVGGEEEGSQNSSAGVSPPRGDGRETESPVCGLESSTSDSAIGRPGAEDRRECPTTYTKTYERTGDQKGPIKGLPKASANWNNGQCYMMKLVKDPVEIHNIKQKDGETIEEFMERFKVETGRKIAVGVKKNSSLPLEAARGTVQAAQLWVICHRGRNRRHVGSPYEVEGAPDGNFFMNIASTARPEIKFKWFLQILSGFKRGNYMPLGNLGVGKIGDTEHFTKVFHGMLSSSMMVEYGSDYPLAHPNCYTSCATITAASKDPMKKIEGGQENVKVAIHHDFLDQEVALGGTLSIEGRTVVCALLKRNLDIFAWQPFDMTGVPRRTTKHMHNIRDGYPPVRQKKRSQAPKRAKAIQAEHDDSWRMYVDFTNLNKACPQDCYPLPKIDWKVESLCGYPFKCFLDAYKGYHQIQMAELDEEKTAFHTPHGVYCYTKMLFGLKNAGATYQRLVDKAFKNQVCQNLEVYVDDLVIKSHTKAELLRDIEETFRTHKIVPREDRSCVATAIPMDNQGGSEP